MSDNKIKMTGERPQDPNLTLEVNNTELEQLIDLHIKEKNVETLNKLANCALKCRVLVPAELNDKKQPVPRLLKNNNQEFFLPLFTSKEQIPQEQKPPVVMNAPFVGMNNMAAAQENIKGIVINPFTGNVTFKKELLLKIKNAVEAQGKAPNVKTVKMTEQQYLQFERKQFETAFLPKKMYEDPQEFFANLCQKRGEFIDQLFEESFQQKRMYPYLPEDFSVMPMTISEELLIVELEISQNNGDVSSVLRMYLTWNSNCKDAHYYTIEAGRKQNEHLLCEINEQLVHINHEAAPVEGAELQRIVDLVKK